MSDDLRALFLRHVCQTSEAPLGIEVARAAGATVWDRSGRAYLDLLAGMGVANVGHTHPEVVAAVRAQAEQYLHVMVYGEFVQAPQRPDVLYVRVGCPTQATPASPAQDTSFAVCVARQPSANQPRR